MSKIDEAYSDVIRRKAYVCQDYCQYYGNKSKCDECIFGTHHAIKFSLSDNAVGKIEDGILADGSLLVKNLMASYAECFERLFLLKGEDE